MGMDRARRTERHLIRILRQRQTNKYTAPEVNAGIPLIGCSHDSALEMCPPFETGWIQRAQPFMVVCEPEPELTWMIGKSVVS